jgi:hypothetical protein
MQKYFLYKKLYVHLQPNEKVFKHSCFSYMSNANASVDA